MCFRENICTCIIHHISKKYFQFSTIHTSRKIAYTKIYRTKKLINKFLDQVKYPIQHSVCMLCVKTMRDMIAKMQDG